MGQSAYEEIDVIKKGLNYGWNSREGYQCYKKEKCNKIGKCGVNICDKIGKCKVIK